jgi:hypothetical protein
MNGTPAYVRRDKGLQDLVEKPSEPIAQPVFSPVPPPAPVTSVHSVTGALSLSEQSQAQLPIPSQKINKNSYFYGMLMMLGI